MNRKPMLVLLAALLAAPAFAQVADPARATPRLQALQAAVSPGKQIFIARQLQLTPAEAADFWPVYDSHQAFLANLNEQRAQLRAELATADEKRALDLAEDLAELAIDDATQRERIFLRLSKVLPAAKAIRYLQIEASLAALVHFEQDAADGYAGG